MSLRFHEIAEANHHILNPFTLDKLKLLGEICQLKAGTRHLDLACGKGELLSQWALAYDIIGVGVDISAVFLEAARQRADELDVLGRLTFVQDDAANYPQEHHQFDVVSCIGATWIGGGLVGTLRLMKTALKPRDGLLLVGEPFWIDPPPDEAYEAWGVGKDDYTTLEGTLDRIHEAGCELLEMVLANPDSWDRYEAMQWMTVQQWLIENPDDPDAEELRTWITKNQRAYLQYGRRYFGWGVFVLRPADIAQRAGLQSEARRDHPDQPVSIDVRDDMLWVRLYDGRIVANPLDWHPWLRNAPPEQQTNVQFGMLKIEWVELGITLDIGDVLRSRR